MNKSLLIGATILLTLGGAIAGPTNPYDGEWSATWTPPGAPGPVGAKVVIDNDVGSWQTMISRDVMNNCAGLKHKISVAENRPDKLVFTVLASQSLAGCPDATMTLKPVDEKHLEATSASGVTIKFTRIK
jgi:hypothetical protein